ncbi:MAG TPA: MYG1 family protein [Candidatus Faecimonas gallistercoris]|nr:MYG1 family protein [Candidatus Faecimonas gallistercoris]
MRLVTDIKEAKYITHNGTMHADEVFATAFLDLYKKDIKVIRVSELDRTKIKKGTIIYDIGRKKFDHHQENAKVRENGIKYSSLGLLFKEYGKKYLKQENIKDIDEVFLGMEKELIEAIDAIDNGMFPEITASYKVKTISDVIKLFNPSYGSNQKEEEQFIKAVELAKQIWQETLYNVIGKVQAKKIVEGKLKTNDKEYLELEEYLPYEETILKSDQGQNIKFVMYPSNRGGYGIKTIRKSLEDKTDRQSFPEPWAGLEKKQLEEVTGIKDVEFCHIGRFLMTCKTKEAAYQVLEYLLQNKTSE